MTEINEELQRCSGCKSTIMLKYFSKNRKGNYLKTCDGCRTRFKCTECDHKCSAKSDLQRHIELVHRKIKHECKDCDYKSSTNDNLQKHINLVHLKIKDYECNECDFKSYKKFQVQIHINAVHLKIKSFECDDCDHTCSAKRDLEMHIKRIHLKIKSFECKDCDHTSTTKYDLQKHVKAKHTGLLHSSKGETEIMKVLHKMEIEYKHDVPHELKNDRGNCLRWDFIIQTDDGPMFIEYDGRQHFAPVRFGGISQEKANDKFQKQKSHDKLKNEYCSEKKYELLRIPYTKFGNIPQLITEFICTHTHWNG